MLSVSYDSHFYYTTLGLLLEFEQQKYVIKTFYYFCSCLSKCISKSHGFLSSYYESHNFK